MEDRSASEQIDDIIKKSADWRGETLARLRLLILDAEPALVEEVKWKMPSRPEGVPVWSQKGIVCVANLLKNAVRLTFPKGAAVNDPLKLFNARLDSKVIRAIDIHEKEGIDENAFRSLIHTAVEKNTV